MTSKSVRMGMMVFLIGFAAFGDPRGAAAGAAFTMFMAEYFS